MKSFHFIQTYFHPAELPYRGPELRPHFILSQFKIEGSTLAAFVGPCEVVTDHLVDWEDRLQNDFICARSMLHFLGEFFGISLAEGVWIQRLIVSELAQRLSQKSGQKIERHGDDLFWIKPLDATAGSDGQAAGAGTVSERFKLSVSIVTASPVSVLLHLGVNIDATGAPVKAAGLQDLSRGTAALESAQVAMELLDWFKSEYESVARACVKVRPVV